MAYVYEDLEDDKDKQQGDGQQLGAGSGVVVSEAAGKDTSGPKEQTGSGTYTNLQSYLDANKAADMGGKVSEKLGQTIEGAKQAQSESEAGFKSAADTGSVDYNEGLVNESTSTPESVVADTQKKSDFAKMRDAQYGGPESFNTTDYFQPAYQKTKQATDEAKLTDTESGRSTLLDQYYGSGVNNYNYTKGQKNLDQLLIQNDPRAKDAFAKQREEADKLNTGFGDLESNLNAYAQQKAAQTAQTRANTRSAIGIDEQNQVAGGALKAQQDKIQNAFGQSQQDYEKNISDLMNQLKAKDISAENAKKLGLNEGMRIYGVDPSKYGQQGTAPTIHSATSKEDAARLQALTELAGIDNTFLPYDDQIGTYDPATAGAFDTSRFLNDVGAQEAAYNELLNRQALNRGFSYVTNPAAPGGQNLNNIYGINLGYDPRNGTELAPFTYGDTGAASMSLNDLIREREKARASGKFDIFPKEMNAASNALDAVLNAIKQKYNYNDILA